MAPSATTAAAAEQTTDVTYEDLIQLEQEFEDADLQIIRHQYKITQPLFAKRQEVISKLPNFWALVFEQVPPELDNFIQPSDSSIFADCLKSIEVTRFEMDDPAGSPRSFSVKFGFSPNKYFDNEVLEKKFWYRRALDGWSGLVSEPVKINWKKGQDITDGLTDAAVELFDARKTLSAEKVKTEFKKLPQYKKLLEKMELSEEGTLSFFTWFGFVSVRPFVTAEESAKATKKEAEDRSKRSKGEKVEENNEEDEDEEIQLFAEDSEVFPTGDELATLIAEDIWPNAIKYFTSAQEADDDDLSSIEDIEDLDDDDDEDEPVDIRALVGKGKKEKNGESSPPAKKRRT